MPPSLAWKNRLRKNVATRSSRWWPSAILVKPFGLGVRVQRAAAQARAQRAHRLAFRHHALDHRIRVLLDDRVRHADRFAGSPAARARESPGCFWSRLTATQLEASPAPSSAAAAGCRASCSCPCRRTGTPSPCRRPRSCRSRRSPGRPGGAGAWPACAALVRACGAARGSGFGEGQRDVAWTGSGVAGAFYRAVAIDAWPSRAR